MAGQATGKAIPGTAVAPRVNAMAKVSVVVPVYNEEPNLEPLVEAVCDVLGVGGDWELLLVDDGSTDDTPEKAARLARQIPNVRLLRLARNYGQTQALQAGFDNARGEVLVSMDGDLQNDPRDIPLLLEKLEEGYDLVAGYRKDRQDRWLTRKVPSRAANALIRRLTGVPIRDNGCSLKAYRRRIVERIHLYSDMHRFIPAMAVAQAGARLTEVPVRHHARRAGQSKYGLSRVWKVLADLLTLKLIHSFRERPLALFGMVAAAALVIGLIFFGWSFARMVGVAGADAGTFLVFPSMAVVFWALAFYLVLLGLVAEVALRKRRVSRRERSPVVWERSPT